MAGDSYRRQLCSGASGKGRWKKHFLPLKERVKKQLEQFGMIRGRLVMVLRLENLYTVLAAAVPGYIMGQIVSFAVIRALTFRQDELPCVETVVPSGNPACSRNVRACHGIPEPPDGYWYLSYIFDVRLKLPYIKDVCLISLNFFIFIIKYILLI